MDILVDWNVLEADFQREYGINLVTASMTWRRFLVLANGLSPDSLWVLTYNGRNNGDVAIEDDEYTEKAFDRMF